MRKLMTAAILVLSLCTVAHAQESEPPLLISGVWARPALVQTGVSAVYMAIENTTDTAYTLSTVAASQTAEEVQIHESSMVDNVMQMNPVDGLAIGPGETALLQPGGFHMMMLGLHDELAVGDAFSLELSFDASDQSEPLVLTIGVPVLEEAPPPSPILILDAWVRPTATRDESGETAMESMEAETTPEAMSGHEMSSHSMDSDSMATAEPGVTITSNVTAIYMHILNRGESDDQLVAARTDAAGVVEIHESRMQDGVMQMRPVEQVTAPVGERAVLEPGGLHMMLMEVQHGLVAGDAIMVTLIFESGLELPVAVPVRDNLAS